MPEKFKTKAADKVRWAGELRVMQRLSDYEFGVELWIMRDGLNRNGWDYRNIEKHYLSFVGQPILCAYVADKIGDGHNMREKIDRRTGETYYSFTDATAERIVGTLSDDEKDFSLKERDGHTWVVASGRLFAFYAPELVEKIVRTGRMEVSAETEVRTGHTEGDIEIFTDWIGLGVTILGDDVAPAIPGANIAALEAMRETFKELKLKAASFNPIEKPHHNETKKGVKTLKVFGKKQVAELSKRFEGYNVLSAAQGEKFIHVCLMSAEGMPAGYTMETVNDTIVPEKIMKMAVNAVYTFGEEAVEVDVSDMHDYLSAQVVKANAACESAKADLLKAQNTITAMETAENTRRVLAAKDMAEATLNAFNANRAEKVEAGVIEAVKTDIEAGVYTNSVGENGLWTGDKAVEKAVLALCAGAVMEMDKKAAEAKKTAYAWNGLTNPAKHEEGSIEDMLNFING